MVTYFSYTPVRLYSVYLIFDFINSVDLACVLDSIAVGGAGLDRVLDSTAVGGVGLDYGCLRIICWWHNSNHALDSAVIGLAAQYDNTNLGWPK